MVPLYLSVKDKCLLHESDRQPTFHRQSDTKITLDGKEFGFAGISTTGHDSAAKEWPFDDAGIDNGNATGNASVVVVGPSGSGKSTLLQQLLLGKFEELMKQEDPVSISAFEITDKSFYRDLLCGRTRKRLITKDFGTQLTKKEVLVDSFHSTAEAIFEHSIAAPTAGPAAATAAAGASLVGGHNRPQCLVISIFYSGKRLTFMELQGDATVKCPIDYGIAGEKSLAFKKLLSLSMENSPATTAESIMSFGVGAADLGRIHLILTLDPFGDVMAAKFYLASVVTLVKGTRPSHTKKKQEAERLVKMPHYAQPTLSSSGAVKLASRKMSPVKKINSIKKTQSNLVRNRMLPRTAFSATVPKSLSSIRGGRSGFRSPIRSSPIKDSNGEVKPSFAANFRDAQLNSLKTTIASYEDEISMLKTELDDMRETIDNKNTIIDDFTRLKIERELEVRTLRSQTKQFEEQARASEELLAQKDTLNHIVNEFKDDFCKFKDEHSGFTHTVNSLRERLNSLAGENAALGAKNQELSGSLRTLGEEHLNVIEFLETAKSDLNEEREKHNNLQVVAKQLKLELQEKNKILEDLRSQIDKLTSETIFLRQEKENLEESTAGLILERASGSEDSERLREDIKELQYQLDNATSENSNLKEQLERMVESKLMDSAPSPFNPIDGKATTENKYAILSTLEVKNGEISNEKLQIELEEALKEVEKQKEEKRHTEEKYRRAVESQKLYKQKYKSANASLSAKLESMMSSTPQALSSASGSSNNSSPLKKNALQPSNMKKLDSAMNKYSIMNKKINKKMKKHNKPTVI